MSLKGSFFDLRFFEIYLFTLKSGELYIGQHFGDVIKDGYKGSPSGRNKCNYFTKKDIASTKILQITNSPQKANELESKYIEEYRKNFGVAKRVLDEYPELRLFYSEGKLLNVSSGNDNADTKRLAKVVGDNVDEIIKVIKTKSRGKKKKVKKKVRQLSTKRESLGIYKNILEASLTTGITSSSILACCHGKQKTAGNCIWEFVS